jgi:hypothetical protein
MSTEDKLEEATLEDYAQAVNPDGTAVNGAKAVAAVLFRCRYEKVTLEQERRARGYAAAQGWRI